MDPAVITIKLGHELNSFMLKRRRPTFVTTIRLIFSRSIPHVIYLINKSKSLKLLELITIGFCVTFENL